MKKSSLNAGTLNQGFTIVLTRVFDVITVSISLNGKLM
jgi:hypothetical protein